MACRSTIEERIPLLYDTKAYKNGGAPRVGFTRGDVRRLVDLGKRGAGLVFRKVGEKARSLVERAEAYSGRREDRTKSRSTVTFGP